MDIVNSVNTNLTKYKTGDDPVQFARTVKNELSVKNFKLIQLCSFLADKISGSEQRLLDRLVLLHNVPQYDLAVPAQ